MKTIYFCTSACVLAASAVYAQGIGPFNNQSNSSFAPQPAPRYVVTDLGPVGAPPAQPFVITNSGLISGGVAVSAAAWHSVLWFQGMKIDISKPGLGGPSNVAFGVNDRGQTVGQAETPEFDPNGEDFCGFGSRHVCQPYLWQNGAMVALPPLRNKNGVAGKNGAANAINNRGTIVGIAENAVRDTTCPTLNPALGQTQQFQFKPVLWQNGTVQELPTVSTDPDGIVFSINDKGDAVGATGTCTAYQASGDLTYLYGRHATLWHNGAVMDLGNLGGIAPGGGNTAGHINNQGQVVGSSGTSDGSFHSFLWMKETGILDLGTIPGDVASVALANNDQGDITGISFDPDFNPRAYIRPAGGVMVDLNSILTNDAGLYLFDACSINSRGEIIGIGIDEKGDFHGYLATPDNSVEANAVSTAPSAGRFSYARSLVRRGVGRGK